MQGSKLGTTVLGEEVGHRGRVSAHLAPTPPAGDSISNPLTTTLLPHCLSAGAAQLEKVPEAAQTTGEGLPGSRHRRAEPRQSGGSSRAGAAGRSDTWT